MRNTKLLGGILYYGYEKAIPAVVIGGRPQRYPARFSSREGPTVGFWIYRFRRWPFRPLVLNFTHPRFALGVTTSGGLGLLVSSQACKMGSRGAEDTHTEFSGLLRQVGFWWFKFYLCTFWDGDGLGSVKTGQQPT